MERPIEHNYGQEDFESWAGELQHFIAWAEVDYYEDGTEVEDEYLEWTCDGVAADEETAKVVALTCEEEGSRVDVVSKSQVDFPFLLAEMRSDGCYAVFDGGDLPVAVVLAPVAAEAVAKHVEAKGCSPVIEAPLAD